MSTIQSSLAVYSAIETVLKQSSSPMTVKEVFQHPAVAGLVSSDWNVRDKLKQLNTQGIVVKHTIAQDSSGDKRPQIAYSWNVEHFEDVSYKEMLQKHNKKKDTTVMYVPTEIELMIDNITIIVGKNPATGRVRISIES